MNTMTMQEQIEMSGLEFMSSMLSSLSLLSSSSSSSSQLQWNSTNQWSPLLDGGQGGQACVTIESGNENCAGGQTIVVIGGQMHIVGYTNSVIEWDPSTKRWRNGPSLSDGRRNLVAVVCRDKVYPSGGFGGDNNYDNNSTLDTIESIQVFFIAGNNGNIDNDKTKQQSLDKAAMSLVVSTKAICRSCCTQPLHCHFGWCQWHVPRLVISGYYGHCATAQQQ